MVAQKITHNKNSTKIEHKDHLKENRKDEGKNYIKTSFVF